MLSLLNKSFSFFLPLLDLDDDLFNRFQSGMISSLPLLYLVLSGVLSLLSFS